MAKKILKHRNLCLYTINALIFRLPSSNMCILANLLFQGLLRDSLQMLIFGLGEVLLLIVPMWTGYNALTAPDNNYLLDLIFKELFFIYDRSQERPQKRNALLCGAKKKLVFCMEGSNNLNVCLARYFLNHVYDLNKKFLIPLIT